MLPIRIWIHNYQQSTHPPLLDCLYRIGTIVTGRRSVTGKQLGYTVEAVEHYRRNWRAIHPEARILIVTGYALDEEKRRILDGGGLGLVQKPFGAADLSRRVAAALA